MMESPPPLSRYIPQSPEKTGFPGSSSMCMDDEVVEIPPPANRSSKMYQKQKEVIFPEIIDVDMDEDCADIMLVDKKVDKNGKGKEVIPKFPLGSSSSINHGPGKGVESLEKNYASGPECLIDGDDFGADLFYGENEVLYEENAFMDLYYDDQYAILQSRLDDLDIPPGVEVPIPWFTVHQEHRMKSTVSNTSNLSTSPIELEALGFPNSGLASSSLPSELEQPYKSTSGVSSHVGAKLKEIPHPKKWEPFSSRLFEHSAQDRKKGTASSSGKESLNLSSKAEFLKSYNYAAPRFDKFSDVPQLAEIISERDSLSKFRNKVRRNMKRFSNGGATDLYLHKRGKPNHVQTGAAVNTVGLSDMPKNMSQSFPSAQFKSGSIDPYFFMSFFPMSTPTAPESSTGLFSSKEKYGVPDEFLKKFEQFKKFDSIEDFSDHHYSKNASLMKQPPKSWAKKIHEEWRILENDLPDTIFVRVYESRMDLLRAVIIGAEGTPYHDGLFFFDVFFPSNYPSVPPDVYYHSRGHRINPNLYNSGKVCLSLLNTWNGSHKEKWIPGQSTILQVLVSIQGLILNSKPFFNEPGYANMSGSPDGEKSSLQYNEKTFILSLRTMVCSIRNPPKYFEDFVAGHFFRRAHDILVACKAYVDGAQVGCLVKGGVQDVDEGDTSCSEHFKDSLAGYIKTLVDAFKVIGVNDCDEFLSLAQKTNAPKKNAPLTPHRPYGLQASHSNYYNFLY